MNIRILLIAFLTVLICLQPIISLRATAQQKPLLALQRQLQRDAEIKILPGKNKRWALVIGVDDYSESQISRLSGAANDARTLADALVRYAGFPEDQVTLLTSDQPSGLKPRRSTILRYLSNLRGIVPKDGLLLISFAGHGIERGGRAFLLPSDALGINDVSLLEDTAISVERIKDSIRATGVGQVILILDACRSDPAPGRTGGANPMSADFRKSFNFDARNREVQAFVTLYATAVGQRAYEYAAKRQGYFTWALIQGLRGEAANVKGEVILSSLLRYVQEVVPKSVQRDLGDGNQQKPFAIVEGYRADELVIALASKKPGELSTETASQLEAASSRGDVIWEEIKNSTNYEDFQEYIKTFPNGRFVGQALERLATLQRKTPNGPSALENSGPPTQLSNSLSIRSSMVMYFSKYQPLHLSVSGSGWDGGSDIKVVVNGKDVSAKINNQTTTFVTVQGTLQELNLQDGKNEVFLVVNGATSNTSLFKLFRPDAAPAGDRTNTQTAGLSISNAAYINRYDARNNKTHSSLGVFFEGRKSTNEVVKVVVNGKDLSQRIAAQNSGYISLSGSMAELNLHAGENEVAIMMNGVSSNIHKFKVNPK